MPFVRFLRRYSLCSGHRQLWPLDLKSSDHGELCRLLLSSGEPSKLLPPSAPHSSGGGSASGGKLEPLRLSEGTDFVVGKTKVFIKAPLTVFRLESTRSAVLPLVATVINKIARRYLCRLAFVKALHSITKVGAEIRKFNAVRSYKRDRGESAMVVKYETQPRFFSFLLSLSLSSFRFSPFIIVHIHFVRLPGPSVYPARILRIACRVRGFLEKLKLARLRAQFKNRPPRTYALSIQRRFRGNASRAALDQAVREKAKQCMVNVRYAKSVRVPRTCASSDMLL